MDADYRRPVKANRYWSRPKARVYDCNMRDAERIYKDNYKEYLAEKDFRLRRDRDWSADRSDRFAHLRAGPVRRREASAQPFSRHTDSSSLIEGILSRASAAHDETEASEPEVTIYKPKPVPAYDPQKENQSLEDRLARLKRLREDLGLPHDMESSKTTLRESRDSASRTFASDNDTSSSSSYKSERASRLASRAGAGANGEESAYSFKSERSSKVNGLGSSSSEDYKRTPTLERKREEVKITPKTERKSYASNAESNDDYSYKGEKKAERYSKVSATTASSSSPVRTRKAVAAAKETLELDDEDDAMMAKMMKKLPSSQQILERISKMDLDD